MPTADHPPETHVNRGRLLDIAQRLISVPSPTRDASAVLDVLTDLLLEQGLAVDRPPCGHEPAPAVVTRLNGARPGRSLQFNGHLDTVHLPFVPPKVVGDILTGSGASDMKGGFAAAVEAVLALRDSRHFPSGSVLLTAHDLHEAPWGFGQQVDRMIAEGYVGDAVLIPEPLCDRLPVIGRGQACWTATIRRAGPPVHEVMRPADEPSVIDAGARLVARLGQLDQALAASPVTLAGRATVFVGQIHAGEIYNGFPQECRLEGTRRWLPGTSPADVEAEFRALIDDLATETRTTIDLRYQLVRDAFVLSETDPLVLAFQTQFEAISGRALPFGPKPFVDDGNSFAANGHVPAITHGPKAGGQHTVNEWVSINDLVRVARLYVRIAVDYGRPDGERDAS